MQLWSILMARSTLTKCVQNRMRAGEVASRSPLMALARMKPALSTRAHTPRPFLVEPRPQADTRRAKPTTAQYAMASATVHQKMTCACPYTEPTGPGASTVVFTSRQRSSCWNGSSARRRVSNVRSSEPGEIGTSEEKATGPGVHAACGWAGAALRRRRATASALDCIEGSRRRRTGLSQA